MRRRRYAALAALLPLLLLCACGRDPMPVPEYPLSAETVAAAQEAYGIDYPLRESASAGALPANRSSFTLQWSDKILAAIIDSAGENGARRLSLGLPFPPDVGAREQPPVMQFLGFPAEEGRDLLRFAAALFGGFEDEDALWTPFSLAYGKGELSGDGVRRRDWEAELGGAVCRVTVYLGTEHFPGDYIGSVSITSDADALPLSPLPDAGA